MSKIFLNSSVKYIPQMDFTITYTENGGIEASQTFIARKSSLGTSDLALFIRGTKWEQLYPEVPSLYRFLTMKTFDPQDDAAAGMIAIRATFTGYQWSAEYGGGGSSGSEVVVPTTSLRPQEEMKSIVFHKKWNDLSDESKNRLTRLMAGDVVYRLDTGRYGKLLDTGFFEVWDDSYWDTPTGDELEFTKMIAEGDPYYKAPSWSYVYRTESETGFTAAQLNLAFKIVENPPGEPVKPTGSWTWMLIAPEQTQSGPDRFIKDLTFQLIEDNDRNQFLYGS